VECCFLPLCLIELLFGIIKVFNIFTSLSGVLSEGIYKNRCKQNVSLKKSKNLKRQNGQ